MKNVTNDIKVHRLDVLSKLTLSIKKNIKIQKRITDDTCVPLFQQTYVQLVNRIVIML